ncbi:MAG: hypothetical protein AAGA12_12800 [Pseudomonadota bacterium]
MSDVLAGMAPSVMRRAIGSGFLFALGGLLFYLAVSNPPSQLIYIAVLIGVGGVSTYIGYRLWQVTGRAIELTATELRLSDGTVICKVEDIAKVDRSLFAFKPSNGFLITMKVRYPRAWAPGLWWRIGKRIGIGGVTPGAGGKIMADTLVAMLAERDGLLS